MINDEIKSVEIHTLWAHKQEHCIIANFFKVLLTVTMLTIVAQAKNLDETSVGWKLVAN